MKLIIKEKNNQVLCRTNLDDIELIASKIKKDVWNSNVLRYNKNTKPFWTDIIKKDIEQISIYEGYDVYVDEYSQFPTIWISGDDGLLELRIVDIKEINQI
tara:strand:+ start:279 stop:581 length:303 start_codon:yes stop_codon:yes gene_type:complete